MLRLLKSPWVTALLACLLFLGTTAAMLAPLKLEIPLPNAQGHASANDDPSWRFRNPEFDQWVEELKHEKEALSLKEQQLRELQTRLDSERAELAAVTQNVHQLQMEFDKNVVRFQKSETENLKHEAKVIAGMSPEGAAKILNEMPDDEMVRILFTMKMDEASAALDTFSKLGKNEAKRAATIAERMRMALPPAPGK